MFRLGVIVLICAFICPQITLSLLLHPARDNIDNNFLGCLLFPILKRRLQTLSQLWFEHPRLGPANKDTRPHQAGFPGIAGRWQ